MSSTNRPRVSLTNKQIQAGIGLELLTLCQTVTEDGTLSNDEVLQIFAWLNANRSSDLPAITFLVSTVERIVADKRVTREERRELYQAIETILPPELRRRAATNRKAIDAKRKQEQRAEQDAKKLLLREERERNRPLCSADFMVAGVHYEGRADIVRRHVNEGDAVYLVREPHNAYSRNATSVRLLNGMTIGYVPEDDACSVAPLLDRHHPYHSHVKKILTGGAVSIPVIVARIYRNDVNLEGLIRPNQSLPLPGQSGGERNSPTFAVPSSPPGVPVPVVANTKKWWQFWR